MTHQKLAILGSTGSIGTQALEIIAEKPELFEVSTLSANKNFEKLASQANRFRPSTILLCDASKKREFERLLDYKPEHIGYGSRVLEELSADGEYDVLLNSLVGFAGFISTWKALERGKKVALANKESLVAGGELITALPAFKEGKLTPVDSEHSAMLQSLAGEKWDDIHKIVITASGGPFKDHSPEQMESITVEDALQHPNWEMGSKITIDSATMMNKGLEIIEAKWLFGIPVEKIEPVIHPQSIIHSVVEFVDGSSKAQLGPPDMKVPILYALSFPERISYPNRTLDYSKQILMEFAPLETGRFPCIELAIDAAKTGGYAPAVLNAANEIAVERFLKKEIRYIEIPKIIESSLYTVQTDTKLTPSALQAIDAETRKFANSLLK